MGFVSGFSEELEKIAASGAPEAREIATLISRLLVSKGVSKAKGVLREMAEKLPAEVAQKLGIPVKEVAQKASNPTIVIQHVPTTNALHDALIASGIGLGGAGLGAAGLGTGLYFGLKSKRE